MELMDQDEAIRGFKLGLRCTSSAQPDWNFPI